MVDGPFGRMFARSSLSLPIIAILLWMFKKIQSKPRTEIDNLDQERSLFISFQASTSNFSALNTWISPSVRGGIPEAQEGHNKAFIGKGGSGKASNIYDHEFYYDVYILNTDTFVWKHDVTSDSIPTKRDSHTCFAWKNKIIVIGGEDSFGYYLYNIHILNAGRPNVGKKEEYLHFSGKKTFQAKVTTCFPVGYSIETVIDGKHLRGKLLSNKPSLDHADDDAKRRKVSLDFDETKLKDGEILKSEFATLTWVNKVDTSQADIVHGKIMERLHEILFFNKNCCRKKASHGFDGTMLKDD